MSNCEHHCENHTCVGQSNLSQTLDELDFERGIWYAAQSGDLSRVQKLLKRVDVDVRDSAGYTSLHYAARNGHLAICKILIQNGADINATTRSGKTTALHRACSAGEVEVVKFLLGHRANVTLQDVDGKTVLHRAAQAKNVEIIKTITSAYPQLKIIKDNKKKLPADYVTNAALRRLFD